MADQTRTHHDIITRDSHGGRSDEHGKARQMVKAATAVTAGGSLLLLSALTLAGSVIGLTVATPLLVIFSPVLVPALVTMGLLITGFIASGGFGIAAITVFSWIYRYLTGEYPPGADRLENARVKLGNRAQEMKDRVQHNTHATVGLNQY